MSRERFKTCPSCGIGKVMTDENRRAFNGRAGGRQVCPDCIVVEIYERFRNG